jgi:hypothetical protein
MNRDRRSNPKCHEYRLRATEGDARAVEDEPDDIAPWLIAEVRDYPPAVADRQVASRIGVGLHQVRRARAA